MITMQEPIRIHPVVDTTDAVDDMTGTTGGFPDILFEGQIYTDADGVSWISVLGEWREVGPTGGYRDRDRDRVQGQEQDGTGTGGFPGSF